MRVKKLIDALCAGGIRAVASQKHVDTYGDIEPFRFFIEWKVVGIAQMPAANVGKKRRADEAQFRHAAMKFFDRCADVLLSKCGRAFDPLWIFRAVFGKP